LPVFLGNQSLGELIRRTRLNLGLSQHDFASALGAEAGQAQVSKWEKGRVRPTIQTLDAIARLAGMELVELVGPDEAAAFEAISAQEAAELRELLVRALAIVERAEARVTPLAGADEGEKPGRRRPSPGASVEVAEEAQIVQRAREAAGRRRKKASGDHRT
jgi:transcriptional regulator with XRE-family HTH domain